MQVDSTWQCPTSPVPMSPTTTGRHLFHLDERPRTSFSPIEVSYGAAQVNENLLNMCRRAIMSQIPTFVVDNVIIHGANLVDLLDHVTTVMRRMTWVYRHGKTVPWRCMRDNIGFKLKFSVTYNDYVNHLPSSSSSPVAPSSNDDAAPTAATIAAPRTGQQQQTFLVDNLIAFSTSFQPWDFDRNVPIDHHPALQPGDITLHACGTALFSLFGEGDYVSAELHVRCTNATHHPLWDASVGVAIRRVPHIYFTSNEQFSQLNHDGGDDVVDEVRQQDEHDAQQPHSQSPTNVALACALIDADVGGGFTATPCLLQHVNSTDTEMDGSEFITQPAMTQLLNIDPRRVVLSQTQIKIFGKYAGLCVDTTPSNPKVQVVLRLETTGAYTPVQLWRHARRLVSLHLGAMHRTIIALERLHQSAKRM